MTLTKKQKDALAHTANKLMDARYADAETIVATATEIMDTPGNNGIPYDTMKEDMNTLIASWKTLDAYVSKLRKG